MDRDEVIKILKELADLMYGEGRNNERYTDDELEQELQPFADRLEQQPEVSEEGIEITLAEAVNWTWIRTTKFSLETVAKKIIPDLTKAILKELK